MTIPAGYRLAVVTPDGTIADTIDLEGMDPTKPLGAQELGDEVDTIVRRVEAGR